MDTNSEVINHPEADTVTAGREKSRRALIMSCNGHLIKALENATPVSFEEIQRIVNRKLEFYRDLAKRMNLE